MSELAVKRQRLLALADEAGLGGVLLSVPGNVAWYTGGGRTHVISAVDWGIASVLVAHGGDVVFTDAVEAGRLQDEELGSLDARYRIRPWFEAPEEPTGHVGRDDGDAAALIRRAREALTGEEVERFRRLGADAAAALTETLLAVTRDTTEYEAAAAMVARLLEREIDAIAVFAAGGERLPLYRHPLPTGRRLGDRVMLVAGARRDGLIACLTRIAAFKPVGGEEAGRYRALLEVERAFLDATVPGRPLGKVFAAGTAAYAAAGFDVDEWHRHHQGGPCGYFARDEIVTPASTDVVVARQAFAWNPSARGLKVEDTYVVGDSGVAEILTVDGRFPAIEVAGRLRPGILER